MQRNKKLTMNSETYISEIKEYFDKLAPHYDYWKRKNSYYHCEIERFYKELIPKGKKILEIGSATGDLLNKLNPDYGVGLDISKNMIDISKSRYPRLLFFNTTIEDYKIDTDFDYIIISNLLEYLFDLYDFFSLLRTMISNYTKVVITSVNPLWRPVIKILTFLKLRSPTDMKNFVTYKDIENILNIIGFEVIDSGYRLFLPKRIILISYLFNKLFTRTPFLRNFCLLQYSVVRPKQRNYMDTKLSCSVVIPCYNEEMNIEKCISSIPDMGSHTEIIVVDDGSRDNTAKKVREIQGYKSNVKCISYVPNKGKGDAVKIGLDTAGGDILIILDADMSVLPKDLVKFYNVLASSQAEFANGTRMVYDMTPGAMKFINYLGNKMFGIVISFIIGQRNTDTLCGTKAFYKKDYNNFRMGQCPWGDFDLLFEASRLKLKIVEVPVHYYPRLAGQSKMKVFKHGFMLLKMCWHGFKYLG